MSALPTRVNARSDLNRPAFLVRQRQSTSQLLVRRGPRAQIGQRFSLAANAVMTLGRHADCDIVLSHISVSRQHAEIRLQGGGFVLTDLGSLNGSYVNRHPIDSSLLADGDELAVGVFRLTFNTHG